MWFMLIQHHKSCKMLVEKHIRFIIYLHLQKETQPWLHGSSIILKHKQKAFGVNCVVVFVCTNICCITSILALLTQKLYFSPQLLCFQIKRDISFFWRIWNSCCLLYGSLEVNSIQSFFIHFQLLYFCSKS